MKGGEKMKVKTESGHPLGSFVFKLAEENKIIDVCSLAMELCGNAIFKAEKGNRAYRIVAADVLGYMTCEGILKQHGSYHGQPEKGGPYFTLENRFGFEKDKQEKPRKGE
jgi:hypothetical protein